MQFKTIFAVVAASLSMAMAEEDITTTSTSTMTQTVTITECNPTATNCPGRTWAKTNTTVSAAPTWYHSNSTTWAAPTHKPTVIETSVVQIQPTKATTSAPSAVATGGAAGLLLQPGLMLGALGAGIALLA